MLNIYLHIHVYVCIYICLYAKQQWIAIHIAYPLRRRRTRRGGGTHAQPVTHACQGRSRHSKPAIFARGHGTASHSKPPSRVNAAKPTDTSIHAQQPFPSRIPPASSSRASALTLQAPPAACSSAPRRPPPGADAPPRAAAPRDAPRLHRPGTRRLGGTADRK
jgi:hypothetical protein